MNQMCAMSGSIEKRQMEIEFYKAFEDRLRGSRELIKSRQEIYLPFVEPLLTFYTEPQAIDLGCGRGEWLELLKPAFGAGARGVDLDEGMLEVCRQLDLSATNADAVTALKELPDESQLVVSGFHIAEHLDFPDLQVLIQEALRVLKPAGLLILETPNPENLQVGSCNFYLDPTHNRPLPPQLLSFLAEYQGFARVKVLRLQEDKTIVEKTRVSLREVLTGASPDYAVVAQKAADASLLEADECMVRHGIRANCGFADGQIRSPVTSVERANGAIRNPTEVIYRSRRRRSRAHRSS